MPGYNLNEAAWRLSQRLIVRLLMGILATIRAGRWVTWTGFNCPAPVAAARNGIARGLLGSGAAGI